MTSAASGASRLSNDTAAADEAMKMAANRLDGPPTYGFLFASPGRNLGVLLGAARRVAEGAPIIGCTTAGEITELGPMKDGVAVMLVRSETSTASIAFAEGVKVDPSRAARELCKNVFDVRKTGKHRRHSTTVLLTDGLSGVGEKVVTDLHDQMRTTVVGGAAADGAAFKATWVGAGERSAQDSTAAMHVASARPWGVGVNHGLRSTTKPMRVTRAQANVVHELDGAPAFDAYVRHAAQRGVRLTPETAGPYMIANELGVHFFDKIMRARAPLSVGDKGSLICAADVPKGTMVSILDGDPVCMIDAARAAAEEAKRNLLGGPAAGVLLFDCICRGMILGADFGKEIDAVRSVFGSVPVVGFLTYGEIARYQGNLDGWHNATAVVAAIPA
jgi:methyl-accepting chemotaxis protein